MEQETRRAISIAEIRRDKGIYRKLASRITFIEKLTLMGNIHSYLSYQRELYRLAKVYGVEIPPLED